MAWLVLATSGRCGRTGPSPVHRHQTHHLAQQQLSGSAGVATVDVSTDGRVVAFVSLARLTTVDDNTAEDIYVLERASGAISLESARSSGRASDGSSQHPRLSGDGRFLVFSTVAAGLIGSETRASTRRWCGAIARPASRRSCPFAGRRSGQRLERRPGHQRRRALRGLRVPRHRPRRRPRPQRRRQRHLPVRRRGWRGSSSQRHDRRRPACDRPQRARRRSAAPDASSPSRPPHPRRAGRSAPRARWSPPRPSSCATSKTASRGASLPAATGTARTATAITPRSAATGAGSRSCPPRPTSTTTRAPRGRRTSTSTTIGPRLRLISRSASGGGPTAPAGIPR